jgi:uncharacterized membrane protein YkoI
MSNAYLLSRGYALAVTGICTIGILAVAPVAADTEELDDCLEQVYEIKHTKDFVKVEYLSVTHDGDPSFEIEARDADGMEWEFMCEADDGEIYEIEQEVGSADDPWFKKHSQVSEQQARQTVTDLYPGTVKEIEYEIESNGDVTYELDVIDDQGTEFKVEVDAVSGDVIEVHVEEWEIGEEADEMASD